VLRRKAKLTAVLRPSSRLLSGGPRNCVAASSGYPAMRKSFRVLYSAPETIRRLPVLSSARHSAQVRFLSWQASLNAAHFRMLEHLMLMADWIPCMLHELQGMSLTAVAALTVYGSKSSSLLGPTSACFLKSYRNNGMTSST